MCSFLILLVIFLVPAAGTFYYGAIISGSYKDPLMARFRVYGAEQRPPLISRFLAVLGVWMVIIAILTRLLISTTPPQRSPITAPLTFIVLAFMALAASAITYYRPELRHLLPRWYVDLLRTTTRLERRHIGYAWMRIPARLRWRLNSNPSAFRVWVELVLLTMIYGAHDPDSPWDMWT